MQFFDALILCVGSKVCDSDTVVKLMGDELRSFYNAVCPYIDQENMTYKNSETSERFLRFLIHNAGYKNPATDYFCRDKFAQIISEK